MKKIIFCLLILLVALTGMAQDKSLFQKEVFTKDSGFNLPYRVMYPENYDPAKKYPMVVFLHGSGERGNDNEKQLVHGSEFLIKYNHDQSKFPAIVIVPQCPENSSWSNVSRIEKDGKLSFTFGVSEQPTVAMQALVALVKSWLDSGKVDKRQVYVGGLSMGGMGTFEIIWRMPNTFAAAFPACGGGDPEKENKYVKNNMGIWIFHGADDSVVPVDCSRTMYKSLKALDSDVRYTEYPGVDHNSWDNMFQETGLMPWLFGHRKAK